MDTENRTWLIRSNTGSIEGPFEEDDFQERLRSGKIPFFYDIRSNSMTNWEPILKVVSEDSTFRRASTVPPPDPSDTKD